MRVLAIGLVALMLALGACGRTEANARSPLPPPPYPSSTPNFSSVPPPTSQAQPGKAADIGQANPVAATPVSPRS